MIIVFITSGILLLSRQANSLIQQHHWRNGATKTIYQIQYQVPLESDFEGNWRVSLQFSKPVATVGNFINLPINSQESSENTSSFEVVSRYWLYFYNGRLWEFYFSFEVSGEKPFPLPTGWRYRIISFSRVYGNSTYVEIFKPSNFGHV